MPGWLRPIVTLVAMAMVVSELHWTQVLVHANVAIPGRCIELIQGGEQRSPDVCLYRDVTVRGHLITREHEIVDRNGASFFVSTESPANISAINFASQDGGGVVFTWQTWALFALIVAIALWGAYPAFNDLRRLSERWRGS